MRPKLKRVVKLWFKKCKKKIYIQTPQKKSYNKLVEFKYLCSEFLLKSFLIGALVIVRSCLKLFCSLSCFIVFLKNLLLLFLCLTSYCSHAWGILCGIHTLYMGSSIAAAHIRLSFVIRIKLSKNNHLIILCWSTQNLRVWVPRSWFMWRCSVKLFETTQLHYSIPSGAIG